MATIARTQEVPDSTRAAVIPRYIPRGLTFVVKGEFPAADHRGEVLHVCCTWKGAEATSFEAVVTTLAVCAYGDGVLVETDSGTWIEAQVR
jgi:hypothetical protein